jgi:YgiT-type zinc finger domain-containing protein
MNGKFFIKTCPTCGSGKIELVVKDVTRKYQDQTYTVPAVEFYMCLNCGEKVYDRTAIQKIEAYSPAYHHEQALTAP